MKKFLFLTLLFLIFPAVSFADISQIGFTTDPQTISPNTISDKITVQTQDSSGSSFQTPETLYLEITSSSATGEFSSSATSWKDTNSLTMSKNSANRTFYYKDSTEGDFTITVNVTGKDWSANQNIVISSDTSQNTSDNTNTDGEVLDASSSSPVDTSSLSGGGSLTKVSSLGDQLEVQAGSDRATTPGSPIWFQATMKKNTTSISPSLSWSFGDGNVGSGALVSHEYKYPGDYVVVLNASAGDIFSVSRLKVKVRDSNISVADNGEYLEIINNGDSEINLFNWKIEDNGKGFIFQPNTIISPHTSIKLDKNLLQMKGLDNSLGISLKNCLKKEIFAVAQATTTDLGVVSQNLNDIKNEALNIQEKVKNLTPVVQNKNSETQSANTASAVSADLTQASTSSDDVIYEVPKEDGFVARLTNFVKSVFSK